MERGKHRTGWLARVFALGSSMTDEQAMRCIQAHGDPDAFAHLVERWEGPIRRLCIRMTGDEHRGEDLAQEAFARVFASREQFQDGRKFSTWLWQIALNLCREESRRVARRREVSLEADADAGPTPAGDESSPQARSIGRERTELIRAAVASLPETQRAVVVLREYEGLKFREIAEVLDTPEPTVKWHMAQALAELSRRLKLLGPGEVSASAVEKR